VERLSARLDNEDSQGEREATDGHLRDCGVCRRFADRATRVTRFARAGVAGHVPDIVEPIIEAVYSSRRSLRGVDSCGEQSESRGRLRQATSRTGGDDCWKSTVGAVVEAARWCGCPCCRRLLGQLTPPQ